MAVSISMNIIQNNQSIENNTSNVTVEIYAHWTRGSYNAQTAPDGYPDARGTVSIDDTQYTFYSKFNTGHTISGSEQIFVKTLDIVHNNEGEKVLSCWASYTTGVSSGTVSTSGSLALPTIPRKSVVKATDGILGVEQVLKVERKSSLLTHTITYQCGTESGVLCEKSSETDIVWTPPISLAAQYPSSISILLVFTVITYHDDKEIGSSAVTVTYTIPESVKPAVSLEVSDMMGYFSKYGAYVQKKSRLRIAVTASESQGARITAYRIEADGKTYTNSLVITEPVSGSGDLTVKVTVTDTRGRTEIVNAVIPVMAYTPPNVSTVAVDRTDEKGNVNSSGGYLTVRFHAAITALSGKNSAVYTLQYKKANEAYYFSHTLTECSGRYTVNSGMFTFAAETASSYNIIVTASDDFESGSKTGVGSSIKKTWSMRKDGVGFAFGKIAEKANTLDMGWDIELNGNHVLRNGAVAYATAGLEFHIPANGVKSIIFDPDPDNAIICCRAGFAGSYAVFNYSGYLCGGIRSNVDRICGTAEVTYGVRPESDDNTHGMAIWNHADGDLYVSVFPLLGGKPTVVDGSSGATEQPYSEKYAPAGDYAPGGYGLGTEWVQHVADLNDTSLKNGWYGITPDTQNRPYDVSWAVLHVSTHYTDKVYTLYEILEGLVVYKTLAGGAFREWNYENPRMTLGVEYRTAERYHGKAVYRKAISFTPSGTLTGSFTVPHGISNFDSIVDCKMNCRGYLPPYIGGYWVTVSGVDVNNINVYNTNPYFDQNWPFYFELAYTKTS